MKFAWDEHYSVKIRMIDEQHQHYFEIVNRIYARLDSKQIDRIELGALVKELVDYAFYHLQTEERFFRDFNYDGAIVHITAHDFYRKTMQDFVRRMEVSDVEVEKVFQELAKFATEWFANHILVEDKKYIQCFTEHGLV